MQKCWMNHRWNDNDGNQKSKYQLPKMDYSAKQLDQLLDKMEGDYKAE